MKAVKQIIGYLRGRGLLSKEQLIELASGGFLRWDEVYEGEVPDDLSEADDKAADLPIEDDDPYESLVRPRIGTKKGKGGHRKVPLLEPEVICGRLAAQFDSDRKSTRLNSSHRL